MDIVHVHNYHKIVINIESFSREVEKQGLIHALFLKLNSNLYL